jgi:hypothetical protein
MINGVHPILFLTSSLARAMRTVEVLNHRVVAAISGAVHGGLTVGVDFIDGGAATDQQFDRS